MKLLNSLPRMRGTGLLGQGPLAIMRQAVLAVTIAASTLLSGLDPQTAHGQTATRHPFAAESHLHLVVKSVTIHDDRDGLLAGQGEMELSIGIGRCKTDDPPPCIFANQQIGPQAYATVSIRADSGETVTLDRVVPRAGDETHGIADPVLGFTTIPNYYNAIHFSMTEFDSVSNVEGMGNIAFYLEEGKPLEKLGTHTMRSTLNQGAKQGDYTVTFEIRRVHLADLRPSSIKVSDLPGTTKKNVCAAIQNVEALDAGPFAVELRSNGVAQPGWLTHAPELASGAFSIYCIEAELPKVERQTLTILADRLGKVIEFNENNNELDFVYIQNVASAQPTPAPKSTLADLTITTVQVNGHEPDGKNDCKDGKNAVSAVIKNAGASGANDFVVALAIDGQQAVERKIASLDAGAERTVQFEDVRLKKGKHALVVTADARDTVSESDEANNDRDVAVTCAASS